MNSDLELRKAMTSPDRLDEIYGHYAVQSDSKSREICMLIAELKETRRERNVALVELAGALELLAAPEGLSLAEAIEYRAQADQTTRERLRTATQEVERLEAEVAEARSWT